MASRHQVDPSRGRGRSFVVTGKWKEEVRCHAGLHDEGAGAGRGKLRTESVGGPRMRIRVGSVPGPGSG